MSTDPSPISQVFQAFAATDVEEEQLGTAEGPCFDCYRTGEPVEVPDLATKQAQWPAFSRIAEERAFQAVHATPLRLRDHTLGTLCLFSADKGPLSDKDAALVQTLADAATIAVLHQHVIARYQTVNAQLKHALQSRAGRLEPQRRLFEFTNYLVIDGLAWLFYTWVDRNLAGCALDQVRTGLAPARGDDGD